MTAAELSELDILVEKARHKLMTKSELERQRVNWAVNNAPEGMTLTKRDLREVSAKRD